jgi:hypothetical protein
MIGNGFGSMARRSAGGAGAPFALLAALSFLALGSTPAAAQQAPPSERVPTPAAEDVATIDGAVAAIYAAISGPAGQPRDWDRFRSVMHPDARLIPTGPTPTGGRGANVWSVEDYIERAGTQLEASGFFENELGRRTDRYGSVVHLMSAYESLRTADGEPFARGVNSFQLFWDGSRWWVMNIFWEQETPQNPIPGDLIGARNEAP